MKDDIFKKLVSGAEEVLEIELDKEASPRMTIYFDPEEIEQICETKRICIELN